MATQLQAQHPPIKPYDWIGTRSTRGGAMWIKAAGQHATWADAGKFETLYISYKGNSNYAIIASIGQRDIQISNFLTEKEAVAVLDDLVQQFGQL